MIKIKVDSCIINHCQKQVQLYNFGKRYTQNGTKEQQLTGIIGQSVVMQMFGLGMVEGSKGFDNGVDIHYKGKKIDVKTMGRNTDVKPKFVNNFLGLQKNLESDILIFCSYHKQKEELTICGWITKKDFLKKANFYPKGTIRQRSDNTNFTTFGDLYEIPNTQINNTNSTTELKLRMKYEYISN